MASPKPTPRLNPRAGDRRGQRPLTPRPSSSLWYGLAFLLLLGLAQMYYFTPSGRTIPYSEFRGLKYKGELANKWLPELIGWVIPLLFFVGIWGFFFRRMGGAEGGVMSFARSRAKIYADDEVKVRFTDVAGVDEACEELKEIVEFLQNPKKYTNLGGRI